jgi:hypothetical protein
MRILANASLCLGCMLSAGCRTSGESPTAAEPATTATPSAAEPSSGGNAAVTPVTPAPVSQAVTLSSPQHVVKSCEPCEFHPAPGLRYEVRFAPGADQKITHLDVKSLGRNDAQRLEVEFGWSPSGEFFLNAVDLNFDDKLDLGFGPVLRTPNDTLQYWLADPNGGPLEYLGSFPNLRVEPANRQLETYEKGGHAGLLYEAKTYVWENGKLVLVKSVSQAQEPGEDVYRETTRTFKGGRLVEEKTRRVTPP